MKVLIFDHLSSYLGKALADAWIQQGDSVIDASKVGGMACALKDFPEPYGFVFTESNFDEASALKNCQKDKELIAAFSAKVNEHISFFLENCRLATQALMPLRKGRVLCLCLDDVSAHILGLPESPILNEARNSAMKSLSKEYSRIGINYNTVVCQPSKEMVDRKILSSKRNALKVFSLRYSAPKTKDYIGFLLSNLNNSTAVNGGLICLGDGVMEMGG